jgi:hypothetical protein
MTEETALDRRILSGKVTAFDVLAFANERGMKCDSKEDLKRVENQVYASYCPPARHKPGTGDQKFRT